MDVSDPAVHATHDQKHHTPSIQTAMYNDEGLFVMAHRGVGTEGLSFRCANCKYFVHWDDGLRMNQHSCRDYTGPCSLPSIPLSPQESPMPSPSSIVTQNLLRYPTLDKLSLAFDTHHHLLVCLTCRKVLPGVMSSVHSHFRHHHGGSANTTTYAGQVEELLSKHIIAKQITPPRHVGPPISGLDLPMHGYTCSLCSYAALSPATAGKHTHPMDPGFVQQPFGHTYWKVRESATASGSLLSAAELNEVIGEANDYFEVSLDVPGGDEGERYVHFSIFSMLPTPHIFIA